MKSTVTLSKVKFQELVSRGLNRPMIAKELGITVKLVNEAFIRWDLKVKKTANAVIWDDEDNYNQLSYVLISNIIHTLSAKKFDGFIGINEWNLTNGVYPGMGLKELLKINTEDFEIYGNHSELALMAKPGGNGKIDFKKTAITLSCNNCNNEKIFNTSILKAMELVDENLPVYIYNILIFPEHK